MGERPEPFNTILVERALTNLTNIVADMGSTQDATIDYAAGAAELSMAGVQINHVPKQGGKRGSGFGTYANRLPAFHDHIFEVENPGAAFDSTARDGVSGASMRVIVSEEKDGQETPTMGGSPSPSRVVPSWNMAVAGVGARPVAG